MVKTARVGIFKITNGLEQTIEETLNALSWKQHIHGRVFLKPNLCSPRYVPGAVTNPELLYYLIRAIREHAEEVVVGESDGYYYSSEEAFEKTGVGKAVEEAGGKIVNLSRDETVEIRNSNSLHLKTVRLPKTLVKADSIVSVPVMKTHEFTGYSGAIKNFFGCLPSDRRILLHPHINEVLSDIMLLLKPSFAVMDATVAMEGNGPGRGIPVKMGLVLASSDLLALDKAAAEIMCVDWLAVKHLKFISEVAQAEGIAISVVGERIEDVKRPFIAPYMDFPVKAQLQIYKSLPLTYLCFNTPLFTVLNGAAKVFRSMNRKIKGEELMRKHWSNMS